MEDIKHLWSILCASSSIDKDKNNLSLFNIVENLDFTLPKDIMKQWEQKRNKPIVIPIKNELVTMWQKTSNKDEEFDVKFEIIDEKKTDITAFRK